MAWKSATQPLPKEVNPKLAFERMFTTEPNTQKQQRDEQRKSILDFVQQDSKTSSKKLAEMMRENLMSTSLLFGILRCE